MAYQFEIQQEQPRPEVLSEINPLTQEITPDNYETEMFGDVECRWYQIAARNGVELALMRGIMRILVVAPTGAGKTLTSGLIFNSPRIRYILGIPEDKPLRLLFVAHKHRLLTQAEQTYASSNNIEFIMQSAFQEIPQEVMDAGWDITCLDEAHHEAMTTLQYRLEQLGEHPIIGLTATPDRADGCVIKFQEIIEPITRAEAVEQGYLAETDLHSFVDTSGSVKTDIVIDMIANFGHIMEQTMIFMRTKKEVREVTEWLLDNGFSATAILDQKNEVVDEILNDFSDGKIKFVVNCNKINEGVDVKNCSDVILGRQFGSYPQLNQVIGRAARPDSDCRVWELVNPLSGSNLDTTIVVGTPREHNLHMKKGGKWATRAFNYTGKRKGFDHAMTMGLTS